MATNETNALVEGLMEGRISRRQFVTRAVALGFSVSTIGSILAACGGTGGPAPSGGNTGNAPAAGQPTTPPGEPTTPPPPTPVVASIGKGGEEIVFWHGLGGADGATMAEMLKTYSSQNPVRVRSETYDWGVFYQKVPTAIVGRTPPDMIVTHGDRIAQFKEQNLIRRADELFFDTGDLPKEDYRPEIFEFAQWEGQTLAVPFDQHGWGMYINTELFEKAGLDPDKMPENGDQFIEYATKMTVDKNGKHPDENGFDARRVQQWGTSYGGGLTMFSTIWSFDGDLYDAKAEKAMLDSANTVKAVQWWVDAIHEHRISPQPGADIGSQDLYGTNRLAMMYDGTWALNFFEDRPPVKKKTRAVFVPSLSNGKAVAWMGSHMLAIPVEVPDDRVQRAKALILWLSNNGATWATSGQIPARVSVQNSELPQSIWSVKVFSDMFAKIGRTLPSHPLNSELGAAWDPAFSAALSKTTPVEEALRDANKQMQAILAR